jgi:hypothetical protein
MPERIAMSASSIEEAWMDWLYGYQDTADLLGDTLGSHEAFLMRGAFFGGVNAGINLYRQSVGTVAVDELRRELSAYFEKGRRECADELKEIERRRAERNRPR